MDTIEYRPAGCFSGSLSLRAADDDSEGSTLVGVSPPWETLSSEGALPGFREVFERGAFENLDDDILATIEHDNSKVIGRTSAGTLKLLDTDEGIEYRVELPNTTDASNLRENIRLGNVSGSSFEFSVKDGGDIWVEEDGQVTRTVKRGGAILRQVGPVARPAYGDSPKVSLRCEQKAEELAVKSEPDGKTVEGAKREIELAEAELSV